MTITEPSGWLETNATGLKPNQPITQLTIPYTGSSIVVFHSRAAAVGMIKNGEISSVRTRPRPKNLRSSSNASPSPSTVAIRTDPKVISTVCSTALKNTGSVNTEP